jgi:hypothetical protein
MEGLPFIVWAPAVGAAVALMLCIGYGLAKHRAVALLYLVVAIVLALVSAISGALTGAGAITP